MKIENVNVKVNRLNSEGSKIDEVFVTCVDPHLNFAMYFQEEHFEKIESGIYTLELSKAVAEVKPAPPVKMNPSIASVAPPATSAPPTVPEVK